MTSIVARLRRERETDHLSIEAADEIERLRAVLATIRDQATVHMGDYEICIDGEELETFIGRALEHG